MQLDQYMRLRGLTQAAMAERLGISEAHLSRILAGKGTPSLRLCDRIAAETEGAVTAEDMRLLYQRARARPTEAADAA